jgi:hypothetical protein
MAGRQAEPADPEAGGLAAGEPGARAFSPRSRDTLRAAFPAARSQHL